MSHISPDSSRELEKTPTESSICSAPDRLTRPSWTEIAIVGLVVMVAVVAGGLLSIMQLELNPVMYGLLLRS